MQTSPEGIAALVGHEGVVPGPYLDSVGVLTYGVGHTAAAGAPNPEGLPPGMPADLDKALEFIFKLFAIDLEKYEDAVNKAFTAPLTQAQFDAAVSFHYNTGAIGRATWVKTFNAGDAKKAATQIMSWKKPPEIIPRRQDEQRLFRSGIYPTGGAVVWKVGQNKKVIWQSAKTLTTSEVLDLMGRSPTNPPKQPVSSGMAGPAALIAAIIAGLVLAKDWLLAFIGV